MGRFSSFTECKKAVDSASLAVGSGIFAELATAFPSFADEVTEAAPGVLDGQTSKSYYATLFLFVLSAPGLYSLVKRSAKSRFRERRSNFRVRWRPGTPRCRWTTSRERFRCTSRGTTTWSRTPGR